MASAEAEMIWESLGEMADRAEETEKMTGIYYRTEISQMITAIRAKDVGVLRGLTENKSFYYKSSLKMFLNDLDKLGNPA